MAPLRKFAKSVQFHGQRAWVRACAVPRRLPWIRRALRLPHNRPLDPLRSAGTPGLHVTLLEPGGRFRRPLPEFGPDSRGAEAFFAARVEEFTAPTYVAEIEDGIAWGIGVGGVFTRDRQFLPAFTHPPAGPELHPVWTQLSLPRPRPLPGRTLYLVTPEAGDNYHHWLIDLLPRIGQVQRAGYDLRRFEQVIVNHRARRYQLATLERLGIAPEKVIAAHADLWVQAERLVVPSLKPNNQALPPADVEFLRQTFLPASPAGAPPTRRLFLSRGDASYRRLRGEAELHPQLQREGFEIVSAAGLDVPAQARLFAEASVIAGPAGAAFANLVFGTPGARVIEIAPPQWLAAFHWMLSARVGLRHTLVLGDGPVMKGVPDVAARQADIVLPPERLNRVLLSGSTAAPA